MDSLSSSAGGAVRRLCLLSNGTYSVMLSDSGSGFSRWHDLSVTRWREDPTRDCWGSYLLLRDEHSGDVWSATAQPCEPAPEQKLASNLGAARAEFVRACTGLESTLHVAVASDADIELRRLSIHNTGNLARRLSLTSYAELVLGPTAADDAHPAFSKMFVQTEWDARQRMLLATRRRRASNEPYIWAAHALRIDGHQPELAADEHETDRGQFLGRCRALRNAHAMQPGVRLSGTTGCVLDPVFALRSRFMLPPSATISLSLWTKLADSRERALALGERLNRSDAADQLFTGAASHALDEQRRLGINDAQVAQFSRWLSALLISDPAQRAAPWLLAHGCGGPPVLWAVGISCDRPIALIQLDRSAALALAQDLLLAQAYWCNQSVGVDVVLLVTEAGRGSDTPARIQELVNAQQERLKRGVVKAELFVLHDSAISDAVRNGLMIAARVVLGMHRAQHAVEVMPQRSPVRATTPASRPSGCGALEFANGHGAFCDGGRSYRIDVLDIGSTPAPWVNVIANPDFGFIVSADGGGYVWSINSQQNPLTPWPNDPVSDSPHEVLYLRDADDGTVWSATALPIRVTGASYSATHGKGWTRFRNDAHGIELELTMCVPPSASIKLSRLRLCNRFPRMRRLSITAYVEWAMGANGTTPAPFVVTWRDEETGTLFARNRWRADFSERVAFIDLCGQQHSLCSDRREFLGALGGVDRPAALQSGGPLSGNVGAGLDPCGALQMCIELPPDTQIDVVVLLGDAADEAHARVLIKNHRTIDFDSVLADITAQWNDVLDTVQVRTPERAMDILFNDWLLYQVTSCRLWARTAYYQASGAYGFRDQLQDVMALCVSRPDLAREHLLRAAGRQFVEGDVQHWWLPPRGQGIRTKISDDRLWLVHVVMHYVCVSGDEQVLDEVVPFLAGQAIPDDATDAFFVPSLSAEKVSVYEHCARAVDFSLRCGAHGLPLIGTGDWNDGMNAVGAQGRGESGWLGWFLIGAIEAFAPCAERRGQATRAERWRDHSAAVRAGMEQAWDGQWYRRGYYDDGTPLGSHVNSECRIDCIAQSWSVMVGATDREHAVKAMESVDRLLVDRSNRLARLFTPPFDHSIEDPGYIKGYPPGVRENGGQYTHGATWSIFAWALLGDGDRAGELFEMLNPIRHAEDAQAVARYRVEPYAVCADVYSVAPHAGRGGWTWYTGSAGWLYRAGLEAIFGFHLRADQLLIDPCIPRHWPGFQISYRRRGPDGVITNYEIEVENPRKACRGVTAMELDGNSLATPGPIVLADDGVTHAVRIVLG